ncbi:MAG: undecaprenyl-diphosphate phosphatase [Acidobacteria bacterium]|nr:MAG: undecaprenyl-diphosphate phosphatase [Acidobacteriota bacterium]
MSDSPLWQAIILGILQGLTEFLPISSSAHLILLPWLLGWKQMGLTFDVALHAGTLLSVLVYFRRDLMQVTRDLVAFAASWFSGNRARASVQAHAGFDPAPAKDSVNMGLAIIVGTIPAVLLAGLAGDAIEYYLRSPIVTVFTLAFFGVLLWVADRWGSHRRVLGHITIVDGLLVGTAQMLALVPGVSRSGITITAALLLGVRRADSARFSFLLGTPVIMLAALKGGYDVWQAADKGFSAGPFVAGIIVSFLSGFLCIKYFLRFLQNRTYLPFVVYRWLLACSILALLLWA